MLANELAQVELGEQLYGLVAGRTLDDVLDALDDALRRCSADAFVEPGWTSAAEALVEVRRRNFQEESADPEIGEEDDFTLVQFDPDFGSIRPLPANEPENDDDLVASPGELEEAA